MKKIVIFLIISLIITLVTSSAPVFAHENNYELHPLAGEYTVQVTTTNLGVNSWIFEYEITNVTQEGYWTDLTPDGLPPDYMQHIDFTGLSNFFVKIPHGAAISNISLPASFGASHGINPAYVYEWHIEGPWQENPSDKYDWIMIYPYGFAEIYPKGETLVFSFQIDGATVGSNEGRISTYYPDHMVRYGSVMSKLYDCYTLQMTSPVIPPEQPDIEPGARVWQLDSEIFGSSPSPEDGLQSQSFSAVSIYEMEKNKGLGDDGQTGSVNIPAGETRTWVSDLAALADVTYMADGAWKVEIATDSEWIDADASGCIVLIGQWDGSVFTPFSSIFNMFSVTWDTSTGKYIFELQGQSGDETVFKDNYLAITITNTDAIDHTVYTGEGNEGSCLTSPENDPGYPLPEMATGLLMGLSLAGLAAFVVIRKKKGGVTVN
jgi:hypothetical protein